MDKPKKGLLIIAGPDKDGPAPLKSLDEGDKADPLAEKAAEEPMDEPDGDEKCESCKFFHEGMCRRFPPFGMDWSHVDPTDWCGEWKPKSAHPEPDLDDSLQRGAA